MDINNYHINIGDIWSFEQSLFLENKASETHVRDLFQRIEDIIIEKGEPFLSTEDYDNGSEEYRQIFNVHIADYRVSLGDFQARYALNYFFTNQYAYYYNQTILIDKSFDDFVFWFALKLRQYDSKLIEIKNFLEYQLKETFNKDLVKFIDFLKLEMKQFRDTIFNDRITETIDGWIKDKNSLNRKLRGKYSSLRLRKLNTNPDHLKKNSHVLNDVLNQLKANNFIHEETLFTDFIRIFEGNIIPKNKRIIWTGFNKDLHWFMNYLVKDSKKVELHRNDIWLVAIKCFIDEDGKEFKTDQLRKASGEDEKRKILLESILAKI